MGGLIPRNQPAHLPARRFASLAECCRRLPLNPSRPECRSEYLTGAGARSIRHRQPIPNANFKDAPGEPLSPAARVGGLRPAVAPSPDIFGDNAAESPPGPARQAPESGSRIARALAPCRLIP